MMYINTALMRVMATVSGLRARMSEERGQDLMEYALLGGLIAAVIAGGTALALVTGALDGAFTSIAYCIDFDATTPC